MISQPVLNRGIRVGQIELHAASASLKASQLMRIAQRLQDEIRSTLGHQTAQAA
jgi:hypothetical protein